MSESERADQPDEPYFPPFRYRRDSSGRIVVSGDVDMVTASALRPVLLASTDPIELDLTDVAFMDSSGVKVLLEARKIRPIHIVTASPSVMLVIEMLGVTDLFDT